MRDPQDSDEQAPKSLLVPPRDGVDIGDYTLRDFAAKWLMQQCDLAEIGFYRAANNALLAGSDSRRRIVFLGDSITEFWSSLADLDTAETVVLNRGIRGQNSSQMLLRFEDDVIALQPALIVLLCGTNDLRSYVGDAAAVGVSAQQRIMRNVTAMADIAMARNVPMSIGAIPPVNPAHPVHRDPAAILAINLRLNDFATQRRLHLIDFHRALVNEAGCLDTAFSADGVHPNAAGYARMRMELDRSAGIAALIRNRH